MHELKLELKSDKIREDWLKAYQAQA